MNTISILGSGAFGTALGVALSLAQRPITLWARNADTARTMEADRENRRRLPGVRFPPSLTVTADMDRACAADIILLAVPMQSLSQLLSVLEPPRGCALVACCKGIDLVKGVGPTALIAAEYPDAQPAILTGPSFAADIGRRLPTALTIACANAQTRLRLQTELATPVLRLYASRDPLGAELGGALKNVIALAAGITMGAGFGESARAAIITRGFAEMMRFAETTQAEPETLHGLSGFGDLILTSTSEKSRNYQAGLALGRGERLAEGVTVEGVATAAAVRRLAAERDVAMPLCDMVAAVTQSEVSIDEAAAALLSRPQRSEHTLL